MILAIDQGTTGTTCLVVDEELRAVGREIRQHFPRPGWVEHDPEELWESVLSAARDALADAGVSAAEVSAIGIANSAGDDRRLGSSHRAPRPLQRAIVWQDRRASSRET